MTSRSEANPHMPPPGEWKRAGGTPSRDPRPLTIEDVNAALDKVEKRGFWSGVTISAAIYFALSIAHFIGAHGL